MKRLRRELGDVVVFGFGAQGRAHALNLRDHGLNVTVYLRPKSKRIADAKECGFKVVHDAKIAARSARIASIMLPDSSQADFYNRYLAENLPKNAALVFAHGLSFHYGLIKPRRDLDVILSAPLAHGNAVRKNFELKKGTACMLAVGQDGSGSARKIARAYAKAVCTKGPFINTSFKEEVETDLFAEQALLCGGLPELVRATFDTLVSSGYNPKIAYFSCLRELAPIVEIMDRMGIAGLRKNISDTARFGALTRGKRIVDEKLSSELSKILSEIRSGEFIEQFLSDTSSGNKISTEGIEQDESHHIEKLHRAHSPKNL